MNKYKVEQDFFALLGECPGGQGGEGEREREGGMLKDARSTLIYEANARASLLLLVSSASVIIELVWSL